ncbi:MAG: 3-carboxy-cis,cis-muconate cycloisomerase, partial [Rhodospirillaceae bacterium]|nr:3-carboxy-cis,cis-muconate cycloisomerase [Rhodospirillaceae bacterium]
MILDAYLQDPDTEVLIDDAALADAMLAVEGILARVQGSLGIIPKPAADHIEKIAATMTADIPGLMEGTIRDGVPIIALLAQLRHAVGPEFGGFVHW